MNERTSFNEALHRVARNKKAKKTVKRRSARRRRKRTTGANLKEEKKELKGGVALARQLEGVLGKGKKDDAVEDLDEGKTKLILREKGGGKGTL